MSLLSSESGFLGLLRSLSYLCPGRGPVLDTGSIPLLPPAGTAFNGPGTELSGTGLET
jgi:hypothetical protein